ncbi:DUF885 family protein [Nocardiopsis sp. NPDC006139]|uniref:DUF885 family protein n=1 Tax=Nocardiopsis sp. NPDC006139 TaxID=3154578 RepID=UPI0033BF996B
MSIPRRPTARLRPPSPFPAAAERALKALRAADPSWARSLGDPAAPGWFFDDRSPEGDGRRTALYRRALHEAEGAAPARATPDEAVDRDVLRARAAALLWRTADLRPQTWNPVAHDPAAALAGLLDDVRLPEAEYRDAVLAAALEIPGHTGALLARLEKGPGVPPAHLTAAMRVGEHLETELESRVRVVLSPASAAPGERTTALMACHRVASAARGHILFAAHGLAQRRAAGPRVPEHRLGGSYTDLLRHTLDTGPDAVEAPTDAEKALEQAEEEVADAAARLCDRAPHAGQVEEALAGLAAHPVEWGSAHGETRRALDHAHARLAELGLVPAGPPPDLVPPARRAPVAAPAGPAPPPRGGRRRPAPPPRVRHPARPRRRPGGPPGPPRPPPPPRPAAARHPAGGAGPGADLRSLPRRRGAAGARPAARAAVRPGLGGARGRRAGPPGLVRRRPGRRRGVRADRALRLLAALDRLRDALAAVVEVRLHTGDLTEPEAIGMLTVRGHHDVEEADRIWQGVRTAVFPAAARYIARRETAALLADLSRARPGAGPRALLAHGPLAPRHLRTLLGL